MAEARKTFGLRLSYFAGALTVAFSCAALYFVYKPPAQPLLPMADIRLSEAALSLLLAVGPAMVLVTALFLLRPYVTRTRLVQVALPLLLLLVASWTFVASAFGGSRL